MGWEIPICETQDQTICPLNERCLCDSKGGWRYARRRLSDTADVCRSATQSRGHLGQHRQVYSQREDVVNSVQIPLSAYAKEAISIRHGALHGFWLTS